jgi:hypothetical protein
MRDISNIVNFPTKKQIESKMPILGNICFSWVDVEFVECSPKGNTIIHFFSGKTYNSSVPFDIARERYLKGRRAKKK